MEVFYSNAQKITNGKGEFYLDFYQLSQDEPSISSAEPIVRIYMNPETVLAFRDALDRNVNWFVERYLKPKGKSEGVTKG